LVPSEREVMWLTSSVRLCGKTRCKMEWIRVVVYRPVAGDVDRAGMMIQVRERQNSGQSNASIIVDRRSNQEVSRGGNDGRLTSGLRWTRQASSGIKYCGTGGREKAETGSCVCRSVHKAPGARRWYVTSAGTGKEQRRAAEWLGVWGAGAGCRYKKGV
jgi:hypothetical protein